MPVGAELVPRTLQDDPKGTPRGSKKPQEAPKTVSKTDFGAILLDFSWFFTWFGGRFRLLLFGVLAVCCFVGLLLCCFVGSLLCWFSGLLVVFWSAVKPNSLTSLSLPSAQLLYIYIYICMYVYVYIYIYMHVSGNY